jgi:hypothetical protein
MIEQLPLASEKVLGFMMSATVRRGWDPGLGGTDYRGYFSFTCACGYERNSVRR